MAPKSVVIVGGSVSGLLQGLQLKRQGKKVTILEQDPSNDRHNHESGVSIGPTVVSLLEKYDATGRPAAIRSQFLSIAWRKWLRIFNMVWPHNMSNWGCLYLILRANFDGMSSSAVPEPPPSKDGDGEVEYRAGKRVIGLSYDETTSLVEVRFMDVVSGQEDCIISDFVIAADGVHSTVRKLLQVPTRRNYAGYIGWRGTVPEKLLSKSTIEYFSNRLNFTVLKGTYFISYFIPTESGQVEPGQRRINWVWYYPVDEGSLEMKSIFTDAEGKEYGNTVPRGLINPDVWSKQVARFLPQMIAPLAEAITQTPSPFVTKVGEVQAAKSSFYDGHVVLVGDAYAGFRSHLGRASEQAARHCVQLDKVWRGEITQEESDNEAKFYAERLFLLNRLIGLGGLGWLWGVFRTLFAYTWLMAQNKSIVTYY